MKNDVLRGHEFHYSKIVSNPVGKDGWKSVYSMKKNHSAPTDEGYQKGRLLISYAHLCFPANEKAVCRFLENCGGKR
jgi:cobyrinic acid a,c-diamide synthase